MPGKVVLLVEDNILDEKLTVRALQNSDTALEVVVLRDGAQALNYLRGEGDYAGNNIPPLPALVLLDLKLPKISGLEVLRELRSCPRTRSLQIIVLTSSVERQDLVQCYALGANSYIRKQVDFVRFSGTVKKLTEYWFQLNEGPPAEISEAGRSL